MGSVRQRRILVSMNSIDISNARQAAMAAADAAEEVIRSHQLNNDWTVSYKSDDSPVTEVDVASEKAIHSVLSKAFPEAAFYGEETGRHAAASESGSDNSIWLIDPIDGTKSFIRQMRYYSTQIALEVGGELLLGVSNAPAYGERLHAVAGQGVWLNGSPVQARPVTQLAEAFLSVGNLTRLAQNAERWGALAQIIPQVRRLRGYGDFCHYHQLCCGQCDLVIESDVNILDIAALTVGVREAGGVITDLEGAPINQSTTSVLAAATKELHQDVLSRFNSAG